LHHIIDWRDRRNTLVSVELGTTVAPETKVAACPLGEQLWPVDHNVQATLHFISRLERTLLTDRQHQTSQT
jgi:hypothetical protein